MTIYFLHDCQDSDATALADAAPVIDDSGNGWTARVGTFDVTSGMIRPTGVTALATYDCGDGDGLIRGLLRTGGGTGYIGLVFRYTSNNNFFDVTFYEAGGGHRVLLRKKEDGSFADVISATAITSGDGHWRTVEVHLDGDAISLYVNGVNIGSATSSHNQTATDHGIIAGNTDHRIRQIEYRDTSTLDMPSVSRMDHLHLRPRIRGGFYEAWMDDFLRDTAGSDLADHRPADVPTLCPDESAIPVWAQRAGTLTFLSGGAGIEADADELTVATQRAPSQDGLWCCGYTDGGDSADVGLVLRYDQSDGSFIAVRANATANTVTVYTYDGSSFSSDTVFSVTHAAGAHVLWVRTWGNDILVSLDDTLLGKATIATNSGQYDHGVLITGIGAAVDSHAITRYGYLHPNSKPMRQNGVLAAVTELHVRLFDVTGRTYEHGVSVSSDPVALGVVKEDSDDTAVTLVINDESSTNLTVDSSTLYNRDNTRYFEDGKIYTSLSGQQTIMVAATDPLRGVMMTEGISAFPHGTGAWTSPRECVYGGDRYEARAVAYEGHIWLIKNGTLVGELIDYSSHDDNEYLHWAAACMATANGVLVLSRAHNEAYIKAVYLPGGDYASKSAVRNVGGADSTGSYIVASLKSDGEVVILTRGTDDTTGDGAAGQAVLYTLTNPEGLVGSAASYTVDQIIAVGLDTIYPASIVKHEDDVFTVIWTPRIGGNQQSIAGAIYAPEIGTHGRWYLLDGTPADVNDALGTPAAPRWTNPDALVLYDVGDDRNAIACRWHTAEITQAPGASTVGKANALIPYVENDNSSWNVYENVICNCLRVTEELEVYHVVDFRTNAAADVSGNGHDGTLPAVTRSTYWSDDVPAAISATESIDFTAGKNVVLEIPAAAAFTFSDGTNDSAFSVSAWIKMTDATDFRVVAKDNTNFEWQLRVDDEDKLRFHLYDNNGGGSNYRKYNSVITAQEGSWIHVVGTYDGSGSQAGINIYLNGSAVDDAGTTSESYVAMQPGVSSVIIGGKPSFSTYSNGKIADVRIYSEELTSGHVTTLHGGGNPDATLVAQYHTHANEAGDGYNGDLTGIEQYWSSDVPNNDTSGLSLIFDGSVDYLEIPDDDDLSFGDGSTDAPFSLSAWIKPTDVTDFYIVSKHVTAEWAFRVNSWDKLELLLYDVSESSYILERTGAALTSDEGTWVHVGATYDGDGTVVLYKNGSPVGSSTIGSGYVAMENGSDKVYIGARSPSSTFASGKIADVRIYNGELSGTDMATVYSGGSISTPLIAHWITKSDIWSTGSNQARMDIVGKDSRFAIHERGVIREPWNRWGEPIYPYYDWHGAETIGVYDVATPFGTPSFSLAETIDVHPLAGQIGIVDSTGTKLSIQTYETPRICETHTPSRTVYKDISP